MANTGYAGYTTLEEYFTDTGTSTGAYKDNCESDPNYISPSQDYSMCPIYNYILSFGDASNRDAYTKPNRLVADNTGGSFTVYVYSNYDELGFYLTDTSNAYILSTMGDAGDCTVTVMLSSNTSGYDYSTFLVATHGGNDVDNMRIDVSA